MRVDTASSCLGVARGILEEAGKEEYEETHLDRLELDSNFFAVLNVDAKVNVAK